MALNLRNPEAERLAFLEALEGAGQQRILDEPLLCKGSGFSCTDVAIAGAPLG